MKWWMVAVVMIMGVSVVDAAEAEQAPSIDLQIKNEARVAADVLKKSLDAVTRIYASAGLAVRWTDAAPRITVTIVSQVLGYDRAASGVMGVALRRPSGLTAQVFLKQVQDFARVHRVDLGTMLAYVIAHEVGHLLLPGRPHSPTGLMQAAWDRTMVHDVTVGALTFTDAQAERIRLAR
jgi:hypothetical protein